MPRLLSVLVLLSLIAQPPLVQADTYPRQPGIDAVHYVFRLRLTDSSNEIAGNATITLKITAASVQEAYLDLTSPSNGTSWVAD